MTIKKGVFAPGEIHIQYQKIQDVYVDQDILDRIMGLYDVHIASATVSSGIAAHIDGVDKVAAEGLKQFLLGKLTNGSAMPASIPNAETPTALQAQSPRMNLSEDISSDTYPLTSKWLTVEIVSRCISTFVSASIVSLFILVKLFSDTQDYTVSILIYVLILVLGLMGSIISLFLWKRNYAFKFTPEHIYYKDGVISISEKHMPYSSIQDVTVFQGVIDRFVGLADVRIENAAQSSAISFQSQWNTRRTQQPFNGIILQGLSLADANKVTEILKTQVLGKGNARMGL